MEVRFKQRYASESEYIYDLAQSSPYFRQEDYKAFVDSGDADTYTYTIAAGINKPSDNFDLREYDLLAGEDRLTYFYNEFLQDKTETKIDETTGEKYNVYERNKEYLNYRIDKAVDAKTFDSLSGFEKVMNTIGGTIGNTLNELFLGTTEGLIDVFALGIGSFAAQIGWTEATNRITEFIAQDVTGVSANRESLQQYARAYTFLDKSNFAKITNDVVTGIAKMAPLLIPGVGAGIYFAGMAGNVAEEAIRANPDINYFALLGYTTAVSAIEIGTEKLSSVFFGGSAIDNLMFKTSGNRAGSWVTHIGLDFLSEGFEESVAEIADSVLYTMIVDPNAPTASIGDILYAGLIGGLIGGISSGTRLTSTTKLAITKDGSIISAKEAKKSGILAKNLTKTQSVLLSDIIQNTKNITSQDAVLDLQTKYSNESLDQIKTNHAEEYAKAVKQNDEITKKLAASSLGLAKILEFAGVEGFQKAASILDYTIEKQAEMVKNYTAKVSSNILENRIIEAKYARANKGSSIKITDVLNAGQKALKTEIKNAYGIDVYFGDIGSSDGLVKNNGLTLDEKTIVLDNNLFNTMSLDSIIETVVKEELVHALQFQSGIIDAKTMYDLLKNYTNLGGTIEGVQQLDSAYKNEKLLVKLFEAQAKAIYQSLLFDEITVNKVFLTNRPVFNKVYKWSKELKEGIEEIKTRRTNKNKVRYNQLLKIMNRYESSVAKRIGNTEDANIAKKEMVLSDFQLQKLLDTFLPTYDTEHFTLLKDNYSLNIANKQEANNLLLTNRAFNNALLPLDYRNIFNPEYYNASFVEETNSRNPKKDFAYNLQERLITEYGYTINVLDKCLMQVVDFNKVTTQDFDNDVSDLYANPNAIDNYTNLSEIFNDEFNKKFIDSNGNNTLANVKVNVIHRTTDTPAQAVYNINTNTITVFLTDKQLTPAKVDEIKHNIFHEATHALANIQGLQNGTSSNYVKSALIEMNDDVTLHKLAKMLLTKDFYEANKNNKDVILDNVSYGIYRITDGEYSAEAYAASQVRGGESKTALKAGATMNRSGFRSNGVYLYGYGRFDGIILFAESSVQTLNKIKLENLRKASEVVGYSKTFSLGNFLQEQGVTDYEKAGFSDDVIELLASPSPKKSVLKDLLNNNQIGTESATNLIIKFLYPNNKNLTTIEDVNKLLKRDKKGFNYLEYAYVYAFRNKNTEGVDKNKPNDPRDVKFDAVLVTDSEGNRKYSQNKLSKNALPLVNALNLTQDTKNKNLLITELLDKDFDFSINSITKLFSDLKNGLTYGEQEVGATIYENEDGAEFTSFDKAAFKDWKTEQLKDQEVSEEKTIDVNDRINTLLNKTNKQLEKWLKRTGKSDKQANELDDLIQTINNIKNLPENQKSMLSDNVLKKLEEIQTPEYLISLINKVMTDENAFQLLEKINNNSAKLKEIYGVEGYGNRFRKEGTILSALPLRKDTYISKINKLTDSVKSRTDLTTKEKSLLNISTDSLTTPSQFETHIESLQEIADRPVESKEIVETPVEEVKTPEITQIPETSVNAKKPNTISTALLDKYAVATQGISEAQFFDTADMSYQKVGFAMIEENAALFTTINNDNYEEIRNDIKSDRHFYSDQALLVFDLYTLEMKGKFSKEIQDKIENYNRRELTKSAQKLALQSKRVANKKPITNLVNSLAQQDIKVTVTQELLEEYDSKLKDKDAYIKELSDKLVELENRIKESDNKIEQLELMKEAKEVADAKLTIINGTNEDLLDWIINNVEDVARAMKIQESVVKKLIDKAEVASLNDKEIGVYMYDSKTKQLMPEWQKKLAAGLKKLKSFRMWSMLSSPVTWVRNWIGNKGMQALDSMTNFFERMITNVVDEHSKFAAGELKFVETKSSREFQNELYKQYEPLLIDLVRGEDVKYETTSEKAAHAKRLARKIKYETATPLGKLLIKASDMTDWGLSTGFLGDEPVVMRNIIKNMANIISSNIDYLLSGIQSEYNNLSQVKKLSENQEKRLSVLKKALDSKSPMDVLQATKKDEVMRLFDISKQKAFQQFFKNKNAFSTWCANLGAKHPVTAELISWVMPFPKVAVNILSMAYRYSPLGFIRGIKQLAYIKDNKTGFAKAEAIRSFSEASVGTFMLIAGAIAALLGWVDIDEDDYLGVSINLGGKYRISLSNLAPSLTTFSTAASVIWAWKNNKSGVTQALNVLYDNTLLGNIDNVFRYSSLETFAQNTSISYLSQYIPAVLKLINKTLVTPQQKDKSGTYLNKVWKTLFSYIPGLSQFVPDKVDPYTGEKVYASGSDAWFFNFLAGISPLTIRQIDKTNLQLEAERLTTTTTGFSGSFKINGVDVTVSDKEKYSKFRAEYINKQYQSFVDKKEKITVEDENGNRITTTYDKLTDSQKANVLNRLYTEATNKTKIKYWLDEGNYYYTSNRDEYNELRRLFKSNKIIYRSTWSKSKFVGK